jgi:hypothetical protein
MPFPLTPSVGDIYEVSGHIWSWDGYGWKDTGICGSVEYRFTGLNTYTVGVCAPSSNEVGDKWFNTEDATEYTYIYDGTSYQWIEMGEGCPSFSVSYPTPTIDFPSLPCLGDTYGYAGKVWEWNDYGWKIVCAGSSGGGVVVGSSGGVININGASGIVSIVGTTQEVEVTTSVANSLITIGLPNNVTITNNLQVNNDINISGSVIAIIDGGTY